ncbi:hypothetical protein OA098_03700, partial [Prochlorococcus sp. AH-736-B04]|nr:hypothetical protein [Prochlorococcus sp. AH-736-B04]
GGDEEIGSIISKAMDIVTSDGVITVEESQSLETELDITEGMSFDRTYKLTQIRVSLSYGRNK